MGQSTTAKHVETSLRLLDEAKRHLENDDLYGACEKGIEAVDHYLRAVGEERGWAGESKRDLYDIAVDLAYETQDPGEAITQHLATEGGLAIEFYGEDHKRWQVSGGLDSARKFISRLECRKKPQRKVRLSQISRERQRKWHLEQKKKSAKYWESRGGSPFMDRYPSWRD